MQDFATAAVLVLFFTLNPSGEQGQGYANGFTDVVDSPGGDQTTLLSSLMDQNTQLSSLMDHLDSYYTPHCLRVLISNTISMNPSPTKLELPILNTTSSRHSIKPPVNIWNNVDMTGSKAKIEILVSPGTDEEVQEIIKYIDWQTEKVNSKSCVTYMLSRPPDEHLLNLLTDKRPKKRLTRYFLVYTDNNTAAESFLLNQQLRKEENVVALVQEEAHNSSYWRVLIRQLLHPSGSPQVLTVNRWSRDTGLASTADIFPEQMANFYGQLLTGGLMDYIPYSDYQTFEGSLYVKYKPCVNRYIMDALAQQYNFTYQMKLPADGRWGSLVNGHYVGVVGDVEFERTLFAFDITVTLERSQNVDFTEYYSIQAVSFLTAKTRPDPLWRKLVTPFRGTVWVCVVVSVVGGSLLYHIIYHTQASIASSHLLSSRAFMQILASFLSQSLHSYNSLQAGRVFLGFWFLYAFLVTSYYKTSLTSTLTVPFVPPTIDTVEELAQAGLYNGMIASKGMAYTLFATSEDPVYKQITQQMEFMTSISEIMKKVVGGQYSFIQFTGILDLLLGVYNSNPQRKTDIHLARDMLYPSGIACAIPQGAPHLRTFSAGLQRLLKAGLISKWIKDLSPLYLKSLIGDELDEDDVTRTTREVKLSLDHLQGPFFILFFGFVGGGLLLVFEILFVAFGRASTGQ